MPITKEAESDIWGSPSMQIYKVLLGNSCKMQDIPLIVFKLFLNEREVRLF